MPTGWGHTRGILEPEGGRLRRLLESEIELKVAAGYIRHYRDDLGRKVTALPTVKAGLWTISRRCSVLKYLGSE